MTSPRPAMARAATLAAVSLLGGAVYLLQAGIGMALPQIGDDLSMSLVGLQWTVNGLTLAASVTLVVTGRLADSYGRRRCLRWAGALFAIGATASALAGAGWILVAGCVVCGMGGAFAFPASMAMLRGLYEESSWPKITAIWVSAWTTGFAIGPTVTGWLIGIASWRWLFGVMLVCALGSLAVFIWVTPESKATTSSRLPFVNLAILTCGLVLVSLGMTEAGNRTFVDPSVIGLMAAGMVALVVFWKQDGRSANCIIDRDLWRDRDFRHGLTVTGIFNAALLGFVVFSVTDLQKAFGFSPLSAGLVMAPMAIMLALGPLGAGVLDRILTAQQLMLVGSVLIAIGYGLVVVSGFEVHLWILVVAGAFIGAGSGSLSDSSLVVAMENVATKAAGVGTSLVLVGCFLGGSIGVSIETASYSLIQHHEIVRDAAAHNVSAAQVEILRNKFPYTRQGQAAIAHIPVSIQNEISNSWHLFVARAFGDSMGLAFLASLIAVFVSIRAARPKRADPEQARAG